MELSPTADASTWLAPCSRIQSHYLGLEIEPIRSNQEAGTPALN